MGLFYFPVGAVGAFYSQHEWQFHSFFSKNFISYKSISQGSTQVDDLAYLVTENALLYLRESHIYWRIYFSLVPSHCFKIMLPLLSKNIILFILASTCFIARGKLSKYDSLNSSNISWIIALNRPKTTKILLFINFNLT